MTNAFTQAKNHITVREAAEHYGLHPNRTGMICCLFHPDKNPSMKLDRRYYCFGCQATGDVIDFTAKLFDLSPKEAAEKLIADFHLAPGKPPTTILAKPIKTDAQKLRENELLCVSVLSDYLKVLHSWKSSYVPKTPNEPFHDRFVEACQELEKVDYYLEILISGDSYERQAAVEHWLNDKKIHVLKERLATIQEEEHCEKKYDIAR